MKGSKEFTILVILSEADSLQFQNGKLQKTGVFLSELMGVIQELRNAGLNIIYATPTGKVPVIDPLSKRSIWFGLRSGKLKKALNGLDEEMEKGMKVPFKFSEISDNDLDSLDALFIPGGHAPMVDLRSSSELGRIIYHFHSNNKPIGAICHGPVALLSTQSRGRSGFPFSGYKICCYSNWEELFNEFLWRGKLEYKMESMLRASGAIIKNQWPLIPHVIQDRELITGQGPTSVKKFARVFLDEVLSQKNE